MFLLGRDSRITKTLLVLMSSLNPTNPTEGDSVFLSRLLLTVLDEKKRVEGKIRSRVPRDHVLLSIPGITSLSAGIILARVGDIRRF